MNILERAGIRQLVGQEILDRLELLEPQMPAHVFKQVLDLLHAVDEETAKRSYAETDRIWDLVEAHFGGMLALKVVRGHCEGADWGCCEHQGTPQQRIREDRGAAPVEGDNDGC